MKGISREYFSKNCLGEWFKSSSRRLTHDCFGKMIQQFASKGSPIYLSNLDSKFLRIKSFCFDNDVLFTFGLCMREGVSEGLRCGYG